MHVKKCLVLKYWFIFAVFKKKKLTKKTIWSNIAVATIALFNITCIRATTIPTVWFADLNELRAVPIPIPTGAITEKINIEIRILISFALN